MCNKDKDEIKHYIQKAFPDCTDKQIQGIISSAKRKLAIYQNKSIGDIMNKNLEKVQFIIDDSMEKEDYHLALKAIELLNKCTGEGNKIQVLTKDSAIQITFDN